MPPQSAARTARARVRDELTREIKEVARRHLAEQGSAALSLRAVAREMGMVSSAIYRYFPSRDELLTALIIDAYNSVSDSAEQAEARVRRTDFAARWLVLTQAVREWALANPQEYALIYGSPVPGYRAPIDTVDPAARLPLMMLHIVADATDAGHAPEPDHRPIPRAVRADLSELRAAAAPTVPEPALARAVMAWAQLIGSISLELFGHLENTVHAYDAYFEYQMRGVGLGLGFGTAGARH